MRDRTRKVTLPEIPPEHDPELRISPEVSATPDWERIFGRSAPLILEIGTGNGVFLAAEAARHLEENFVGIEQSKEFFLKCKRRIVALRVGNVRLLCADATEVFDRLFLSNSLDALICNFSDPWPKRRHRERRVFRAEFLDRIGRAVKPGGRLRFKTDVGWYFNLTVNLLRRRPEVWQIIEARPYAEAERESEAHPQTNFEAKARRAGETVWGFVALKI